MLRIPSAAGLATLIVLAPAPAAADMPVDVALVLAVDVSRSVSLAEAAIQREGYAVAFESDAVVDAIRHGLVGRIAVSYVEWSSPGYERVVVDWTIVEDRASAEALAGRLRSQGPGSGGTTSISSALAYSERMLDVVPWPAERRVIDISGDGQHNYGASLTDIRRRIIEKGIVINGLPVGSPGPNGFDVITYYRRNVIGGPGAFLVSATGTADFANAVRTKIALEIAGLTPDDLPPAVHLPATDYALVEAWERH